MDLSIILVHYHTPALAAEAVARLRESLDEPALRGLASEIVLVDNGSDAAGRELLASLPARRIDPGTNLGYAGGLCRGMEETRGERVVGLNPDVLVGEGCLARLLDELSAGAAVAGPRFFLDRGGRFVIPPTERRTRSWEVLSALADRGAPWTRPARRIWRRHAQRHWRATEPLRTPALSGALLAFSRETWRRAGPFDATLPLYFEEDDWLRRVRRCGLETRYVPDATAVHLHARSTAAEPRAARWFAESRRQFRRRWYGRLFTRMLERLEPGPELVQPWPRPAPRAADGRPRLELAGAGARTAGGWIELSLSPRGFPAAARRLDVPPAVWEMPEDLWTALDSGTYSLAWVDDAGEERGRWSFAKPAGDGGDEEGS